MKPVLMGLAMGPMMLWMLHGQLTGSDTRGGWALLVFFAAHVAVLCAVAGAAVFAAHLSPAMRDRLARMHRPSLAHLGLMGIGVLISGAAVHVVVHGGLV